MSNGNKKMIEALRELNKKLEDPVYLAQVQEEFDLMLIRDDNRLICAVIDPQYREATVGDMIMYGLDHDYYDKLEQAAMNLFYQNHGNGD